MVGDAAGMTVLLGGDVMLGRGVDQILQHPGDPTLHEPVVRDARRYVELAEKANGQIPKPVNAGWPWGDALQIVDDIGPAVRLINLETTITSDGEFAARKAVHYRMHPDNVAALTALRPDICALANNHILDFGRRGLADTMAALTSAGIQFAGAGADLRSARRPAVITAAHAERRVLVGSVATTCSGVPESWAAHSDRPGLWLIRNLSDATLADDVAASLLSHRQRGDVAIVSVHWGPNWGYGVGQSETQFAHRLIDAGIDIVHGHSSHHPRPIEIYRGKPILYGCGDVVDDYEGISGHESYRTDLRLLYLICADPCSGTLISLKMIPLQVRRMRLLHAGHSGAEWLRTTIEHISRRFGIHVVAGPDDLLTVIWGHGL